MINIITIICTLIAGVGAGILGIQMFKENKNLKKLAYLKGYMQGHKDAEKKCLETIEKFYTKKGMEVTDAEQFPTQN